MLAKDETGEEVIRCLISHEGVAFPAVPYTDCQCVRRRLLGPSRHITFLPRLNATRCVFDGGYTERRWELRHAARPLEARRSMADAVFFCLTPQKPAVVQ